MALYQEWQALHEQKSPAAQEKYFADFLEKEKEIYKTLLSEKQSNIVGTVSEIAQKYKLTDLEMAGFLDGINESIESPLDIDSIEADSQIDINIDFEKLYKNMLSVPADWLYNLPEWDEVLPAVVREEMAREYKISKIAVSNKIGRNEPCPCGSGKKYKNCCDRG